MVLLVFAGYLGSRAVHVYLPRTNFPLSAVSGVMFSVGLFASLLVHELLHCVAARRVGLPVVGIRFAGIGGLSQFGRPTAKAGHEALIAAVGPLANMGLAVIFLLAAAPCRPDTVPWLILKALGATNLGLGVFNALPGLPLDGGRVLMAAVWRLRHDKVAGMRVAASAGVLLAGLVGGYGVIRLAQGDQFSVYALLVAAVMYGGAKQARRGAAVTQVLPGLVTGMLARRAYVAAGDLPLAEALVRAESSGATAVVIGTPDGGVTAVMSGAAVDAIPASRRPWVPLSDACREATAELVLPDTLAGDALVDALRSNPTGEYIVVDEAGCLVGILATVDVLARVAGAAA